MTLTPGQQEQLINQYDPLVRALVCRFKKRNGSMLFNKDDLYQEAMLVLFESIGKRSSLEGYRPPVRDMINAMCRYTLGEQVVSVPKRTSDYSRRISTVARAVDLSLADDPAEILCDSLDNIVSAVHIEEFISILPSQDRQILRLKLKGLKNREVARRIGISDVKVNRRLRRLRQIYIRYAA